MYNDKFTKIECKIKVLKHKTDVKTKLKHNLYDQLGNETEKIQHSCIMGKKKSKLVKIRKSFKKKYKIDENKK